MRRVIRLDRHSGGARGDALPRQVGGDQLRVEIAHALQTDKEHGRVLAQVAGLLRMRDQVGRPQSAGG